MYADGDPIIVTQRPPVNTYPSRRYPEPCTLYPSRFERGQVKQDLNYCQRCGNALAEKTIEGRLRRHCASCGFIAYLDPKLAAVVLVQMEGRLVLVKRGVEPALGQWAFPSGFVDRGEAVEDAAVREVKEETGIEVRLTGFLGLYSSTGSPVVMAAYSAEAVGGKLQAGHDAAEAALFYPDDLPPLPFPHDERILKSWRASASS
jgi:8-oxo-dGTP diphosphatase